MRHHFFIFFAVFCLLTALPLGAATAADTIKIGCLVSLTLTDEQKNTEATAIVDVLQKAASVINAKGGISNTPLEIVVRDVKHDRDRLLHEAHVLAKDLNVLAIVGPSDAGLAPALRDYAETYSVPVFLTEGGDLLTAFPDKPAHDWTYSLLPDITAQARTFFDAFSTSGIKKITPVLGTDDNAKSTLIALKAYGVEKAINLSSVVKLTANDTSGAGSTASAAAWGRGSSAKAAIVWGAKDAVKDFMESMNPDASSGWQLAFPLSSITEELIAKWPEKKWRLYTTLPPVIARWEPKADKIGTHPSDFALMRFKANMRDDFTLLPIEARLAAAAAWDSLFLIAHLSQGQPVLSRAAVKNAMFNLSSPFNGVTACLAPPRAEDTKPVVLSESIFFVRWDGKKWLPQGEESDLRLPSF